MKRLVRALFVFSGVLVFLIAAHSQTDQCAVPMVVGYPCTGENNCHGFITLIKPGFGSNPTCLAPYIAYCCNIGYLDYTDEGFSCSYSCDDAVKALLKNPDASEFTLTHTLWAKDCSGHYRPFARSWDAPEKPIDLRPRLALSGIGG